MQFHETGYGRKFFDRQLPELIKSINRLADSNETLIAQDDIVEKIHAYNDYIMDAAEEGRMETGWCPVCFDEFVDCEYTEMKTVAEQTDLTAIKQWFEDQIKIAGEVGPMGVATKLTLLTGLTLVEEIGGNNE